MAQKKENIQKNTTAPTPQPTSNSTDLMSQCVTLCQEERWREAVLLYRKMLEKAKKAGNDAMCTAMEGALQKIEYSMRRQMASSAINGVKKLLIEEYLLDVGK